MSNFLSEILTLVEVVKWLSTSSKSIILVCHFIINIQWSKYKCKVSNVLWNSFSFCCCSSMTLIWHDVASVDEERDIIVHFFCYKLFLVLWSFNLIHITLSVNVLWCYICYFDDKRIIFLYICSGRCLLMRAHRCIPFLIRFWFVIKKHFSKFL